MPPTGGVRLDGGPVLSENEASALESDVSSIISISDTLHVTDTDDDQLRDAHKYRLPSPGKTRLHLRTKEPLSPTPRRQDSDNTPSTPRTGSRVAMGLESPLRGLPRPGMHHRNSSVENLSDGTGLSRAGSVYTLGRASFAGQLSQLTAMRLPDAESLAKHMSDIPTSKEAAKALDDAADQIRLWIGKAEEVLNGLNAEDDVEWAAAGGRDGIEDVDAAINRFEKLVQVYILSIERLQKRRDVVELSAEELTRSVSQMESIMGTWQKVKQTVAGIKEQVELAVEWEQLWNSVLGESGQEMDALNRLVFEMEEKRHQGAESLLSATDSIDLNDLETIIEQRPGQGRPLAINRFSASAAQAEIKDEANLLALFARMQPLRAALDFLPMRLSSFGLRGKAVFPSACEDLEKRREQLENMWQKLESDAESLRRELGEDRWIIVFRNAGKQALKMCESVGRSYTKLKDAVDAGEQDSDPVAFIKKVESYDAKKIHYGPAIERVLAIIDRGVLDRLTVNGEVLRLQSDMKQRWSNLQGDMRAIDETLEGIGSYHDKQLRESVSTVVSSERSLASSLVDTPGSSPASSVVEAGGRGSAQGSRTPTPLTVPKGRHDSARRLSSGKGSSLLPRSIGARQSDQYLTPTSSPQTRRTSAMSMRPGSRMDGNPTTGTKPRWSRSLKMDDKGFAPLSAYEPSPYAKPAITPKTNFLRSSMAKAGEHAARTVSTPSQLRTSLLGAKSAQTRKSSLPVPTPQVTPSRSMSPVIPKSISTVRPASRLATGVGASVRRSSMLARPTVDGNEADSESPSRRPPSALGSTLNKRRSMLGLGGRNRAADTTAGAQRPVWRP